MKTLVELKVNLQRSQLYSFEIVFLGEGLLPLNPLLKTVSPKKYMDTSLANLSKWFPSVTLKPGNKNP